MSKNETSPTSKTRSRGDRFRQRFNEKMAKGELDEFQRETQEEPSPEPTQEPPLNPPVEPYMEPDVTPATVPREPTDSPRVQPVHTRELQDALTTTLDLLQVTRQSLSKTARDAEQLRTEYNLLKDKTFNEAVAHLDSVIEKKKFFDESARSLEKVIAELNRTTANQSRLRLQHLLVAASLSGLLSGVIVSMMT